MPASHKPDGYTSVSPYVDATYRRALAAGATSVQEPVKRRMRTSAAE